MAVRLCSVERGYWNRFVQVGMASLAISASALLVWPERPARVHADETYNETIVPPLTGRIQAAAKKPVVIEPVAAVEESTLSTTPALPAALQPIAQSLDIPSAPCNCGKTNSEDSSPIYVSAFGGASYFDTESKTSFGGIYGMNLTAQLDDRLGVMATGLINNYSAGSQFGGTVGGYLHTKYYGESYERFGGTVAFDQFTDTGLGSPYLAQGRVLLKYQVLPSMLASVQYTQPLIGMN